MDRPVSPPASTTGTDGTAAPDPKGATLLNRLDEERGLRRLGTGAGVGLAAGLLGLVFPVVFLWLASYNPGGFFTYGATLLETTGFFVFAGAVLFLVSLFVYRRGFAILRRVDSRFTAASILCIVGSIGFILLLISAAILVGSSNSLIQCIHGAPSHALSCLRSGQPLGAATGLIGFWLGWMGGVGIVMGLAIAGKRYGNASISRGGALYAVLLLVVVGPVVALLTPIPGLRYLLLLAPLFVVLAPGLVLGASRQALASVSSAAGIQAWR